MVTTGKSGPASATLRLRRRPQVPRRVKCAILPWHAVIAALDGKASRSAPKRRIPDPGRPTLRRAHGQCTHLYIYMQPNQPVTLQRDVQATLIPAGTP